MIKKEPKMDVKDIFAAMFVFLGGIVFLIAMHILSITNTGNLASVLRTTFIIFLRVFEALLLFAMVYVIIHFLKWLVWSITTPKWMKNKMRGGGKF